MTQKLKAARLQTRQAESHHGSREEHLAPLARVWGSGAFASRPSAGGTAVGLAGYRTSAAAWGARSTAAGDGVNRVEGDVTGLADGRASEVSPRRGMCGPSRSSHAAMGKARSHEATATMPYTDLHPAASLTQAQSGGQSTPATPKAVNKTPTAKALPLASNHELTRSPARRGRPRPRTRAASLARPAAIPRRRSQSPRG